MKPLILFLLFLCSCSPCKHLQNGDKVDLGWTKGNVILNCQEGRKLLIRINADRGNTITIYRDMYYTVDYNEVK
jgi:hypothetical protein